MADPVTELLNFTIGNTRYTLNAPPVVLGAVLGAIIAGIMAWLNGRSSRKQFGEQLKYQRDQFAEQLRHERQQSQQSREHEAEQAKQDRKLGLRRDVYLQASAWASEAIKQMSMLINLSENTKTIASSADAPARVLLVGSKQTIDHCLALQGVFLEMLRDFSLRRVQLQTGHRRMLELTEKVDAHNAGIPVNNFDAILVEHGELLQTHLPELSAFALDVAKRFEPAVELAAEFQISMSRDLGFEPDVDGIRVAMREYNRVGRASAEAIFKQLAEIVKEPP